MNPPIDVAAEWRDPNTPRRWWPLGDHRLAIELHDHAGVLVVDTRNFDVSPSIIKTGLYEPWNERIMRALLRPGDRVISGGACFGYHVIGCALLVGPSGRVLTFEANPWLFDCTIQSAYLSGVSDRVITYLRAVGRQPADQIEMYFERTHAGGGGFGTSPDYADDLIDVMRHAEKLPPDSLTSALSHPLGRYRPGYASKVGYKQKVSTLDELAADAGFGAIRLIQLDIETESLAAVLGAKEIIERSPELVLITEWSHFYADNPGSHEAWNLLASSGFRAWRIIPPAPHFHELPGFDQAVNSPHCDLLWLRG